MKRAPDWVTFRMKMECAIGQTMEFERRVSSDAIEEEIRPVLEACDRRFFELNLRILAANKQAGQLTEDEYKKFTTIMALMGNILMEPATPPSPPAELDDADRASA